MAIVDDYREAEERAQAHGFTRGTTAPAEHGYLYQWEARLRHATERVAELSNLLRAHRLAITGPDERLAQVAASQTVERPPNPSKIQALEDAVSDLQKHVEEAHAEFEQLAHTGLVEPGDHYF
jgi:predicted RNase H-like nuclease (RuvC/YqgF family)